jgi:hypothetical protein
MLTGMKADIQKIKKGWTKVQPLSGPTWNRTKHLLIMSQLL